MRPERKKSLMIAGGIVGVIIITGVVGALLFNINSYKSKIETAVSEATGLDVKINGRMGFSFFPLGISAKNIHVTSQGGEILSLERLKLRAELIPLLKKQLKMTGCELVKPAVTIVKRAGGKYNFEGRERKLTEGPGAAISLQNANISDGTFSYLNQETG
jgi:AsmA protein